MGTTGAISIDLNNIGNSINYTNQLAERTLEGVADQGALIGLAVGLAIAIVLLLGIVLMLLSKITTVLNKTRGIGGSMR